MFAALSYDAAIVMGRTLIKRYAAKRSVQAVGGMLPFGFGAAIGAGFNYKAIRSIARDADTFFRQLAPSSPTRSAGALTLRPEAVLNA